MKKARIALAAIAVIAITGGVMAHKAKSGLFLYTCNTSLNTCSFVGNVSTDQVTTSNPEATITNDQIQGLSCNNLDVPCTTSIAYSFEQ